MRNLLMCMAAALGIMAGADASEWRSGREEDFEGPARQDGAPYAHEEAIARAFLESRGAKMEPYCLEYKYGTETLRAFSDDRNKAFAVVVAEEYEPYMRDPVLAYGIGNAMWNGADAAEDNSVYHILSRYEEQILQLKRDREVYHALRPSSYKPDPAGVEPLLGGIAFGQDRPYNAAFPKEVQGGREAPCVAGCGPVALAQVLSYYRWPSRPEGSDVCVSDSGKEYRLELGQYPLTWDGSDADLSALMLCSAASVSACLGVDGTSSMLINFKSALVDHWGYSPACTYISDYYDANMLALLYQELDGGRPVIVGDESHMFVCDGYYRDFLHFNLGWYGYCNGYYRAVIVPSRPESQLPFREMLIGIRPLREGDLHAKTVRVSKPGTLSRLLTDSEKKELTSLTVSGSLNGEDIACLRQMAGAVPLNAYERGHGSLMHLDLRKARIVGEGLYITRSARGMSFSGSRIRQIGVKQAQRFDFRYDMDDLSDAQWEELVEWGIHRNDDWLLQRSASGQYYISYFTQDDAIGPYMFEDCDNLRDLHLPSRVETVKDYAFYNCRTLQHIYGLPSEVEPEAFRRTRMLERKK